VSRKHRQDNSFQEIVESIHTSVAFREYNVMTWIPKSHNLTRMTKSAGSVTGMIGAGQACPIASGPTIASITAWGQSSCCWVASSSGNGLHHLRLCSIPNSRIIAKVAGQPCSRAKP
jgi:hypothetical protein